jgi:hypothetical protein
MLMGTLNIALATETNHVDYERVGLNCVVDVPDKPLLRMVAYGQMYGDYYSGNGHADRIQISVRVNNAWKVVVGYEDNPTRSAFSESLGMGVEEHVVKPGQIQVLRDEDSNTNMLFWNVPLEIPATDATDAFTLPPGKIFVTGYGSLVHYVYPTTPGTYQSVGNAGWSYSIVADYYKGTGSFFCKEWGAKWVAIGGGTWTGSNEPRAIVGRVWTWVHA